MTHLDERTVVALRDREATDQAAWTHLESCPTCRSALQEAEDRAAHVEAMLRILDGPERLDVEAARTAVRARLAIGSGSAGRARGVWFRDVRRAAAVLLVAAGAASALPGSPVRRLLSPAPEQPPQEAPDAGSEQEARATGVSVALPAEGIRVLISSLGPLSSVEVVWVDEPNVRVDAPAGSRFTYGEGRVEALVAGGPVRIEVPRTGGPVSVSVEGVPYLNRGAEGTEIAGPVRDQDEDGIVFGTP